MKTKTTAALVTTELGAPSDSEAHGNTNGRPSLTREAEAIWQASRLAGAERFRSIARAIRCAAYRPG